MASVSSIDAIGEILIDFKPPLVYVPENWSQIFTKKAREGLTEEEIKKKANNPIILDLKSELAL